MTAGRLCDVMLAAAAEVAALGVGAVETKSDGSPVTAVDRGIDRYLHQRLTRLDPDAGWLSEESADDRSRLTLDRVWVVDPLDGTREFARGIPEYAISVGLAEHGEAVAGAVMNPATGEGAAAGTDRSWTEWGPGAVRASVDRLCEAVVSVSRTEMDAGVVAGSERLVAALRPIGSVAYKLLRVARRCEHLTFTVVPKSEWDICGGVALIANRGLRSERLDSRRLVFNQPSPLVEGGLVAGSAALAVALRQQIAATGHLPNGMPTRRDGQLA